MLDSLVHNIYIKLCKYFFVMQKLNDNLNKID